MEMCWILLIRRLRVCITTWGNFIFLIMTALLKVEPCVCKISLKLHQKHQPAFGNTVYYNTKFNKEENAFGHEYSYEKVVGPHTFAYKFELNYVEREMLLEKKVTTDFDIGSVSTAIGIKNQE